MKIGSRVKLAPSVRVGYFIANYEIFDDMMFRGFRTVRETYWFNERVLSVKLFNRGKSWYYPVEALIEKES